MKSYQFLCAPNPIPLSGQKQHLIHKLMASSSPPDRPHDIRERTSCHGIKEGPIQMVGEDIVGGPPLVLCWPCNIRVGWGILVGWGWHGAWDSWWFFPSTWGNPDMVLCSRIGGRWSMQGIHIGGIIYWLARCLDFYLFIYLFWAWDRCSLADALPQASLFCWFLLVWGFEPSWF